MVKERDKRMRKDRKRERYNIEGKAGQIQIMYFMKAIWLVNAICTIQHIVKKTVIHHAVMSGGPHICQICNQPKITFTTFTMQQKQ